MNEKTKLGIILVALFPFTLLLTSMYSSVGALIFPYFVFLLPIIFQLFNVYQKVDSTIKRDLLNLTQRKKDKMLLHASENDNIDEIKYSKNYIMIIINTNNLDLVYIDAAHDYDSVKQDILTWLPKIKKGGFIAGHDYRYDPNIGVYEAVNDIFVNDYKINSFPDSSFIIKL